MEINITKEALNVSKIVCEKKEIINIQGDMIVPDSKPDILNTINTEGNVCIYKKEIMDGKIKIDGNILTYIMYFADSGEEGEVNDNIRGLNTNLDFSEIINIAEIEAGMNIDIVPKIKMIECKVINGRKVGIKINLELKIKIFSKENIEIVTNIDNNNVQILSNKMKMNVLLGEDETKTTIKENISIPTSDNLAELLGAQINLVDKDVKTSYNKIIAKSEMEIKFVYLTEEGKICSTQTRVPVVGFIDMPDVKEENLCEVTYNIKNIVIKPNAVEDHSIYLDAEVEIYCTVYEEREIQIIQDMYCPLKNMKFNKSLVNTISNKSCKRSICNIREKISIPELNNNNIVNVKLEPIINRENRKDGKIIFEGELEANIIFSDHSTVGINTKKITIPFEQSIGETDDFRDCKMEIIVEPSNYEFLNSDGNVSANVDLSFEVGSYRNSEIPVISNITMDEMENMEDYSVIMYIIKKGDSLWNIAKRFNSTVDEISRVNGIENPDKISVGEKIYIPRYTIIREDTQIA